MPELTKMTTKGQVVIPIEIRRELGLSEGNRLVVSRMNDIVLIKKLSISDPKKEFEELTRLGAQVARKKGIRTEDDVVSRIHKSRGAKDD